MFPEREGWHLLQFSGITEACRWRPLEKAKEWITTVGMVFTRAELARSDAVAYIGPVLIPTQIAELLAAERERCAKLLEDAYEKTGKDFEYLGCLSCADEIRNLGAAP